MSLFLAVATAVGSAGVGGVYFAFSVMVMPAYGRLPAEQATAAMLEINRRAERGAFIGVFGATIVLSILLAATAIAQLPGTASVLYLVAGALSFASALVTVVANVPLNNRLARDGVAFWKQYFVRWTQWNGLRALLALGAVGLIVAAAAR
jgi:uncharacterized membrane protein